MKGGDAVFGNLVVAYLFLGGAGAGACFVLSVLALRTPSSALAACDDSSLSWTPARFRPLPSYARLFARGQTTALSFLVLGACCLAADLGRFDKVLLLFVRPAPTVLSFGAWSLTACACLAAAMALAWRSSFRKATVRALRTMALVQAIAAFFTMVYTGLLLGSLAAVPLWHGVWLPALFAVSSVSCGLALVSTVGLLGGSEEFFSLFRGLMTADAAVIVVEAAVLACLVACAASFGSPEGSGTQAAAEESVALLLGGPLSGMFWLGFVGAGMVLPLALEAGMAALRAKAPLAMVATCGCVLAGGLAMRCCFVAAGVHPAIMTM